MDRKWIVLIALIVLPTLAIGCSGSKDTPVTTPPVDTRVEEPAQDVAAEPTIDTGRDVAEEPPPKSIQELQDDYNRSGLLGDVFFDFDKYDIRSDARERLARNAEFMNSEGRDLSFTIEGHCDERGTNEYNIALGQNRANAALDYLASLGVSRSRFRTVSYGEEKPFCTESNEACWQKNRRARFVISGRTGG